jgi:membrane protein
VIDDLVTRTLRERQGFWLSLGAVFTVWQVSGAARAVMAALANIYASGDQRPAARRYPVSFGLGIAVTACILGALAVVRFGPGGWASVVLRWGFALALLFGAVWLLLRFAPDEPQATNWVSFGSALCVVTWVVTSLAFGFYVTQVADYGSVFGPLASGFLLMTYLYVSACAFLAGAQVDALLRAHLGDGPDGDGFPGRVSGNAHGRRDRVASRARA